MKINEMNQKIKHPVLSSSAFIGNLELKNRMIMAAMGSNFASEDGHASEQLAAYYEERARGGVGLIILETSAITWPAGASMPNMIGFSKDEFIPTLQSLTQRVHQHGAKIAAQLNHSGKIAQEDVIAGRPIPVPSIPKSQPSDMFGLLTQDEIMNFIKAGGPDGKGPRYHELSIAEIQHEVQHFVDAAKRAKASNFDAIEIHAGHGYLISSFLSPAVNKRTDEYGGTPEKRARLLVEIISQIKKQIEDFPILVRLDANEYRIENGITPDDFLITASLAQKAGADAIDVSAYGNTSKGIAFTEAPLVHEPGGFLEFVRMAKKALSIPVVAVGRIELDVAERGLKNQEFDFLAMGRKLLADPGLPNKIISGQEHLIRPCIYCYICVSQIFINKPIMCAVNSQLGNKHRNENIICSSADQKKSLVIGAGPSGMEAARLLAMRGHDVEIWEKDKDIGGTVRVAALAYEPNGHLINYLKNSLSELRVEIKRLHQKLDNTMIYVTHDQIEAMTLANRIAIMRDGLILQLDKPKTIYNYPVNKYVAEFIGSPSMNFLKGKIVPNKKPVFKLEGGWCETPDLSNYKFKEDIKEERQIWLGVRPESIVVGDEAEKLPVKFNLEAEVVEPMGADTLVWSQIGGQEFHFIIDGNSTINSGDSLRVGFDPLHSSIFDLDSEDRL